MSRKQAAFVTKNGQHNFKSLAKDVGFDKLVQKAKAAVNNDGITDERFWNMIPELLNADSITDVGIKVGTRVTLKMIESAYDNIINGGNNNNAKAPASWISNNFRLNNGVSYFIDAHVGYKTSNRILKSSSLNNLSSTKKTLASSAVDFDKRRQDLDFSCGFNQKNHIIFMEKTYLRVEEIEAFAKKQIEDLIEDKKHERREQIYLMGKKSEKYFQFRNTDAMLPCKIKIHMCLLKDQTSDLEKVILGFTNNNKNTHLKNGLKLSKKYKSTEEEIDKLVAKEVPKTKKDKEVRERIIEGLEAELKDIAKKLNEANLKNKLGVLDEKYQVTDPKFNDYSCQFLTTNNCELEWYGEFKNNIKITQTWVRTLQPGDTLNFNMSEHMGKGINLNAFVENRNINENYPISYFYYVELSGGRDCGIIREHKDRGVQEPFYGSCPTRIHTEFKHAFSYIKHNDDKDETPASYIKESNDANFLESSTFAQKYQEERVEKLNVKYEMITPLGKKKDSKEMYDSDGYKYTLGEDSGQFDDMYFEKLMNVMNAAKMSAEDRKHLNEEDKDFNFDKEPSVKDFDINDFDGPSPPPGGGYNQPPTGPTGF